MEYKAFKDLSLSRLGMGNMRLPVIKDDKGERIDRDKAREIIDYAMANGINYYDTAYIYHNGESEKFVGDELVSRYPRESFYIATKYLRYGNPDYKAVFEKQLRRLKTDYIDFYLIHSINDGGADDYLNCGCIEYFEEQQKKGRIKYLGFSSHASPATLRRFATVRKWDFAQIQLNYYDWIFGTAKEEYEILCELDIPVVVMETVRGGKLASLTDDAEEMLRAVRPDWSIPSWAFRFVKSLPQVMVALSGMSNMEQIKENIATYSDGSAVNEKEKEILLDACRAFKSRIQVPCTECRYCCDDCPSKINIPAVLDVYNDYKIDGWWILGRLKDIDSVGKPKDCIGCEVCMAHCPQGIDIAGIMNELKSK